MKCVCGVPVRAIFRFSRFVERQGPAVPTPQYVGTTFPKRITVAMAMTGNQQTTASLMFIDAAGNPTVPDGIPAWFVDSPAVVSIEPAADGLSCLVAALGPIGTATITARADADLGDGIREIISTGVVDVVVGEAVTVTMDFSTPVNKPTPPTP